MQSATSSETSQSTPGGRNPTFRSWAKPTNLVVLRCPLLLGRFDIESRASESPNALIFQIL
jgi:hypothetical protein